MSLIGSIPENAKPYILQRWSTQWHKYVNILSAIEIGDGDKLLAVPQPRSMRSGLQKPDDDLVGGNKLIVQSLRPYQANILFLGFCGSVLNFLINIPHIVIVTGQELFIKSTLGLLNGHQNCSRM